MTRVIQWATGVTGTISLRHVIERADLELVGVRVYDPAKAGVDAGTLCGAGEVGLHTTADRDEIIRTDADVVLYMGKVEKVNGELFNIQFETFPAVKDPLKMKK